MIHRKHWASGGSREGVPPAVLTIPALSAGLHLPSILFAAAPLREISLSMCESVRGQRWQRGQKNDARPP